MDRRQVYLPQLVMLVSQQIKYRKQKFTLTAIIDV